MTKAKEPVVPHDLLTSLCAVVLVVSEDPKKVKFVQDKLGKSYNLSETIAFAKKHNEHE